MQHRMEKKTRPHRRSPSSSSSSSSSSTSSSSSSFTSSSSTSYDSRRPSGGQTRISGLGSTALGSSSHRRQCRLPKKSRSGKRALSGSDRTKTKKAKTSSSSRKHGGSKSLSRKASHASRKEYKDYTSKEYDRSYKSRSPVHHHRRSGNAKKLISPHNRALSPAMNRKARKQGSPSVHRKVGHKKSSSPRDRMDFHHSASPSSVRLRDPRIERNLKRSSPEILSRERYRESPKRYDKEEYTERHERVLPASSLRQSDSQGHKDLSRHKRDHHDDRRREDREKDLRDRDPREKKMAKEKSYKERIIGSEREERDREGAVYMREVEYGMHSGREFESGREFFGRVDSRESSVERGSFGDPFDRFERDHARMEGRGRYDSITSRDRKPSGDFGSSSLRGGSERRIRQIPLDPIETRYGDERRKGSGSHHDQWAEDHRSSGGPSGSGGILERHQEPGESHSYPHHRRGELSQSEWMSDGSGRRMHDTIGWEKHPHKKRRVGEWTDEYSRDDWGDHGPDWGPGLEEGMHVPGWIPSQSRRYGNWNEGDRGSEWGSGGVQKRLSGRSPNMGSHTPHVAVGGPPSHVVTRRGPTKNETPICAPEVTEKTPPRIEPEVCTKTESKIFSPLSPAKSTTQETTVAEAQTTPTKDNVQAEAPAIEQDNFSDFSDDADDILNQETAELPEEKLEEANAEEFKTSARNAPSFDEILDEEERMDLEEISDDDFEEEKQIKYSVADALDIDWSTLKVDPGPATVPERASALKRFSPLNLLSRLGVSTKYARPEILQRVTEKCYQMEIERLQKYVPTNNNPEENEKKDSNTPPQVPIKEEGTADTELEAGIKQENEEAGENTEEKMETNADNIPQCSSESKDPAENSSIVGVELSIQQGEEPTEKKEEESKDVKVEEQEIWPQILPVVVAGGVVRYLRHAATQRSRLFCLGPKRKALCSADDLAIRRRLCHQPEDELIYETQNFDKQLFNQAVDFLKSC